MVEYVSGDGTLLSIRSRGSEEFREQVQAFETQLRPIRRRLRDIRRSMREEVESLGRRLAVADLLAGPVLVLLAGFTACIVRHWGR